MEQSWAGMLCSFNLYSTNLGCSSNLYSTNLGWYALQFSWRVHQTLPPPPKALDFSCCFYTPFLSPDNHEYLNYLGLIRVWLVCTLRVPVWWAVWAWRHPETSKTRQNEIFYILTWILTTVDMRLEMCFPGFFGHLFCCYLINYQHLVIFR